MAKYILTNKAVGDLSQIWEYTYEVWSEIQADKYYEVLVSSFSEIVQKPEAGKRYIEIDSTLFGFRVGQHIVFYRITKATEIEIIRILHQRMDLKSQMEK